MIVRRDQAALIAWIEAAQHRGFAWRRGRDCVSFALGGVEAQTGVDVLAGIALWSTLREARVVAAKDGGLAAQIDARMDRVPPALAQRGDVAGLPDKRFGVRLMLVRTRPAGAGSPPRAGPMRPMAPGRGGPTG